MYQSKGIDIIHMNKNAITLYLPDNVNCEHVKLKIGSDVHISPTCFQSSMRGFRALPMLISNTLTRFTLT